MSYEANIAIEAGDTLENLVQQFADQFAFLRELVQNSIDAGSTRVDIDFDYTPNPEGQRGVFVLHVNDTGEGMTREIIDTRLTRLFASSKEGDMTKIGKFGIGFVSIFALQPKAVFLDTGRDGESWRIWFKEDRTFDRLILPRPVEGTQIKWIKEYTPQETEQFRHNAYQTLKKWCKHAEAEIYFAGELLNEDFEIQHPLAITHETQGTYVSAAPSSQERPRFGFYNRGLTLAEGEEAVVAGVEFKLRSRYLEHTLTRDNIIKDKNYDKALAILKEAVEKKLRPSLFSAARAQPNDENFGYLAYHLHKLPPELELEPILPSLGSRPLSLRELRRQLKQQRELLYESQSNLVVSKLQEEGLQVVRWRGPQEPGLGKLLHALAGNWPVLAANQAWACPSLIPSLPPEHEALLLATLRILQRAGSPFKKLLPGKFDYSLSQINDRLYLACEKPQQLIRTDRRSKKSLLERLFAWSKGSIIILNLEHPCIQPHFRLKPEFSQEAPYLLASAIVADDGISPEQANRLLEAYLANERS